MHWYTHAWSSPSPWWSVVPRTPVSASLAPTSCCTRLCCSMATAGCCSCCSRPPIYPRTLAAHALNSSVPAECVGVGASGGAADPDSTLRPKCGVRGATRTTRTKPSGAASGLATLHASLVVARHDRVGGVPSGDRHLRECCRPCAGAASYINSYSTSYWQYM